MKEPKFNVQDIVCVLSHPDIPFVVSKVEENVYNGYEYTLITVDNGKRVISQLVPETVLRLFHPVGQVICK